MEALQTNAEPDGRAIALQQERDRLERYRQLGIDGYDSPGFTDQFTAPINDEIAWASGYGMQGAENIARNLTGRPVEVSALDRARAMRQISNEGQDQFVEDYPVQAFTGGVLGGAAMAPARGAAIPGLIGRLGTEAGLGAAYGAAEGDSLSDRLSGAGFGAGVGLALGGAAELAAPHIGRLVNRFRGRGGSQAVEDAGYRVESSQDLAPTDTPESLRAQGYEIDPATNTWARTVATEAPPVDYPIRAFHGSPHSFDRFSLDKIGTGEGAQAYGHGLYFAESEDVARQYRDTLSGKLDNPLDRRGVDSAWVAAARDFRNNGYSPAQIEEALGQIYRTAEPQQISAAVRMSDPGSMYEVGINADPNTFLDWDAPLAQQPLGMEALRAMDLESLHKGGRQRTMLEWALAGTEQPHNLATGRDLINAARDFGDRSVEGTDFLRSQGINGIRYLDAGSRGVGEGSRNYVLFNDELVKILRKYGISGLSTTVGASALAEELDRRGQTQEF